MKKNRDDEGRGSSRSEKPKEKQKTERTTWRREPKEDPVEPGENRRVQRFEKELQQMIAQFLISKFKSPLPGIVSVAYVIMPPDLKSAKVYISLLTGESQESKLDEAVEILQSKAYEVQKFLGENLKVKFTPKLKFYPDTGTEKALKIEKILKDLNPSGKAQ